MSINWNRMDELVDHRFKSRQHLKELLEEINLRKLELLDKQEVVITKQKIEIPTIEKDLFQPADQFKREYEDLSVIWSFLKRSKEDVPVKMTSSIPNGRNL